MVAEVQDIPKQEKTKMLNKSYKPTQNPYNNKGYRVVFTRMQVQSFPLAQARALTQVIF